MVALARRMYQVFEPYHAMIYFAPEPREAFKALGLKGYWMGYFASRSAPLGQVPPAVVTALFYNFHPAMVARALPDAWGYATPEQVLRTRDTAADLALRRCLSDQFAASDITEAARLARRVATAGEIAGRPMYAAHATLPWPEAPHVVLWRAATLIRERRFDGHVAALVAQHIDGIQAHITLAATDATSRQVLQANRGWTDADWDAAMVRLQARGWLDEQGALTEMGREGRQMIESMTDDLATAPWQVLTTEEQRWLYHVMWSLADRLYTASDLPIPNPMGINWDEIPSELAG